MLEVSKFDKWPISNTQISMVPELQPSEMEDNMWVQIPFISANMNSWIRRKPRANSCANDLIWSNRSGISADRGWWKLMKRWRSRIYSSTCQVSTTHPRQQIVRLGLSTESLGNELRLSWRLNVDTALTCNWLYRRIRENGERRLGVWRESYSCDDSEKAKLKIPARVWQCCVWSNLLCNNFRVLLSRFKW